MFESGIYHGFLKSILQDFDLNLVNNVDSKLGWILSPTFNVPVMHDHGSIVFWLPLGIIGQMVDRLSGLSLATSRGQDSFLLLSVLLTTQVLILYGMTLLKNVIKPQSISEKVIFWTFPLTTPLIYYGFFEFGSADIVVFFWACFILASASELDFGKKKDLFIWGLIFGIGRVIKISYLFWIPYFLFEILNSSTSLSKKNKIFFFFAGVLSILPLKWVNDFIEFGFISWNNGYGYDFDFPRPDFIANLQQNLFGNYGLIFIAFWLFLGLVFTLFNLKKFAGEKRILRSWQMLALIIGLKFIYECLCLSDNETEYGFRRYLVDVPFITWMAVQFWRSYSFKNKSIKFVCCLLFSFNFLWSFYYLFWNLDMSQRFDSIFGVYRPWQFGNPFSAAYMTIINFVNSFRVGYLSIIFIFLFALSLPLLAQLVSKKSKNMKYILTFTFLVLYLIITLGNSFFNQKNVALMNEKHLLDDRVVSSHLSTLLYDEIVSEIGRSLVIAKYTKDKKRFDENQSNLKSYIAGIQGTLLQDPIQFADHLNQGILRPSYYEELMDVSSLTEFDTPSFYDEILGPYQK